MNALGPIIAPFESMNFCTFIFPDIFVILRVFGGTGR